MPLIRARLFSPTYMTQKPYFNAMVLNIPNVAKALNIPSACIEGVYVTGRQLEIRITHKHHGSHHIQAVIMETLRSKGVSDFDCSPKALLIPSTAMNEFMACLEALHSPLLPIPSPG